jgi:hypothetical protein
MVFLFYICTYNILLLIIIIDSDIFKIHYESDLNIKVFFEFLKFGKFK